MKEHYNNKTRNFVCGWYMDDLTLCDELISFHAHSERKQQGGNAYGVDKNVKDSIDVYLFMQDSLCNQYLSQVIKPVCEAYKATYPWCNKTSEWEIIQALNIQHYPPKGGFHQWHTERALGSEPYVTRHLVFMTYLNDVTDCGETEFLHQELKIKPEKGLTIVWPTDWTFTHRGIASPTQDKYIITGWYNFVNNET